MRNFQESYTRHQYWLNSSGKIGSQYTSVAMDDDDDETGNGQPVQIDIEYVDAGLNLSRAVMGYMQYTGVDFKDTDFTGADFTEVTLQDCDISGCTVTGATFKDAGIYSTVCGSFVACSMVGAQFTGSLHGCEFIDCNLTGASFAGCDLSNVVFRGCTLVGADLYNADVTGAWFDVDNRFDACTLCGIDLATLAVDYNEYVYRYN